MTAIMSRSPSGHMIRVMCSGWAGCTRPINAGCAAVKERTQSMLSSIIRQPSQQIPKSARVVQHPFDVLRCLRVWFREFVAERDGQLLDTGGVLPQVLECG